MSPRPEDAPLGAGPMLPPPSGAAAARAKQMFDRYLDQMRGRRAQAPEEQLTPVEQASVLALVAPQAVARGRRYDVALTKVTPPASVLTSSSDPTLALPTPQAEPIDSADAPTHVMARAAVEVAEAIDDKPPMRPPPFAPTIRPPVLRREVAEQASSDALAGAADTALLVSEPDGSTAFEIAINDDLFRDLSCRVSVADGVVVATFRVVDVNLKRLLEAEAPRLRAQLEARGLKVAEVRVEVA